MCVCVCVVGVRNEGLMTRRPHERTPSPETHTINLLSVTPLGGHQHRLLAAFAAPDHAEVAHAAVDRHVDEREAAGGAWLLGQPQLAGFGVGSEEKEGRGGMEGSEREGASDGE